jgi:hypothetical protein
MHGSAFFDGRPRPRGAIQTLFADQPQQIMRGVVHGATPHGVERAAVRGACDDLCDLLSAAPQTLLSERPEG